MKKVPQARQETPSSQPKREAPKVRSEAGLRQTLRQLHKLVFEAIDAAERRPTVDALDRLEYVMSVQLDAEAETIHTMGSAEGGDAQAVLRFSLRRMCERGAPIDARRARLRVVRDLFVAHSEREELITIPRLEAELGPRAAADLAKKLRGRARATTTPPPSGKAGARRSSS